MQIPIINQLKTKKMKKVFLALAIMVSLVSFGQDREGKGKFKTEEDLQTRLKEMTATLNLNEKQQHEVKLLLTEQFEKRKTMREDMKKQKESGVKLSDEKKAEMKKQMIDEQLEMKTKMKKILTAEQMKKLEEIKKQKGEKQQKENKHFEKEEK